MPIEHRSEHLWVAKLDNEPGLSEDLVSLKDQSAQATPPPNLIIDLTCVTDLNSTNLSQLLRLRKYAIDRQVKLMLAGATPIIRDIFSRTALDEVFEFAADLESAVTSVEKEAGFGG